jgi:hypothetical protein
VKGAPYHPLHDPYLTTPLAATILVFMNATPTSLNATPTSLNATPTSLNA